MFAKRYARHYNLFNSTKPYCKEARFVYKWAGNPESIFDIGCGTAKHWSYYPRKTILQGIDRSEDMINQSAYKQSIFHDDITTYKHYEALYGVFECATALFDVINYIPEHGWWKNIPLFARQPFIFDIWDADKVKKDGFGHSFKLKNGVSRTITKTNQQGKKVDLKIVVNKSEQEYEECHTMYLHSKKDIERFCGRDYKIAEIKPTESWQTWYKLIRK